MKALRKALVAAALVGSAVFGTISSAAAHDYNWGGLYIGVGAGWVGSDVSWTYRDPTGAVVDRPINGQSSDAAVLSGIIGLQHQWGRIVLGIEGAINGTVGFSDDWGTASCFNPAFNCQSRVQGHNYTLGARLGFTPVDRLLLFVSGGAATMNVQTREVNAATGVVNAFGTRDWHNGWYIGGGIEYALTRNWSLGLEYQHYMMDDKLHLSTVNFEHRLIGVESDMVRARLTYKIGREEKHHEPMK